jgi:hypothetical protein
MEEEQQTHKVFLIRVGLFGVKASSEAEAKQQLLNRAEFKELLSDGEKTLNVAASYDEADITLREDTNERMLVDIDLKNGIVNRLKGEEE